jgi:hypothetical protein
MVYEYAGHSFYLDRGPDVLVELRKFYGTLNWRGATFRAAQLESVSQADRVTRGDERTTLD